MKTPTCLILIGLLSLSEVNAQTQVLVTVEIKNQLTGVPIDASLAWLDEGAIKKVATGKYTIALAEGTDETLTITKDGYFDQNLVLDYDREKSSPSHEIKLQPGIPQLYISVVDDTSDEFLSSAVDLFTMGDSSIVFSEEVEVSPYTIDLEYNQAHILQVRRPGYFSFKDTIDFTNVFDGRVRNRKIRLVPLKAGNKISLSNIYFKPNEANLTGFASMMLVELTHVLERQKNIVIEIGAFTDGVGTDDYNLALSEKRAIAVKKYLVEKGAAATQLVTKGYGETQPVAPNDTEENRALNRRVEFKILSIK